MATDPSQIVLLSLEELHLKLNERFNKNISQCKQRILFLVSKKNETQQLSSQILKDDNAIDKDLLKYDTQLKSAKKCVDIFNTIKKSNMVVSAQAQFLRTMANEYQQNAKEKGGYSETAMLIEKYLSYYETLKNKVHMEQQKTKFDKVFLILSQQTKQLKARIFEYKKLRSENDSFPKKSPFGSQDHDKFEDENSFYDEVIKTKTNTLQKINLCLDILKSAYLVGDLDDDQYQDLLSFADERQTQAASKHQDSKVALAIYTFLEALDSKELDLITQQRMQKDKMDCDEKTGSKAKPF